MSTLSTSKLETFSRFGYATRGVVYLIVGGLAVLAALGRGGETTDARGALGTLLAQPFGTALLALAGLGLVGYASWRFVQGLLDADRHGNDAKGLAIRGGLVVSGITHVVLALFALGVAFGWSYGMGGGGGSGGGSGDWTATLMAQPFGRWLVAAVGLAVVGAGAAQAWKGWTAGFERYIHHEGRHMRWVSPVSRFGLIARGLVFAIIGGFLIVAALQFDPSEARGLEGTLDTLRAQPFGQLLLGVVALGLFAFGVYSLVEARYRRIPRPPQT